MLKTKKASKMNELRFHLKSIMKKVKENKIFKKNNMILATPF